MCLDLVVAIPLTPARARPTLIFLSRSESQSRLLFLSKVYSWVCPYFHHSSFPRLTPFGVTVGRHNMAGLNFDVLLVICRFITDVSTVLSFSLTCSTLRPVAIERRVSMRPVAIDQTSSLRDLYNFIFVDEKTRSPHIHTITIEERNPGSSLTQATSSEGDIDCMVAILASATHMRTLFLHVQRP